MQRQITQTTPSTPDRRQLLPQIILEARDWLLEAVRSAVPAYEDAEDIVQDVLYQFTRGFDEIRSLEASTAWLYRAARNRVADFYRNRSRTLEGSHQVIDNEDPGYDNFLDNLLQEPSGSAERHFERQVLEQALERAIDRLPDLQRDVFIWHEIEGRSFGEIQALTGDPLNTLLSRKRYAVLSLREFLKEYQISTKGK